MKIIQIIPRFWPSIGGAETVAYEISRHMVQQGHEVMVLTTDSIKGDVSEKHPEEYRNHTVEGIRVVRFGGYRFAKNDAGFVVPGVLKALWSARDVDVIHAHSYGYFSSYFPCLVRLFRKTPLLYSPYYAPELSTDDMVKRLYDATIGRFSFRLSDHIIALTEKEKIQLVDQFSVPVSEVSVIPPGIDLDRFLDTTSGLHFRQQYDLKNKKIILFVGRIVHTKGLAYLIQALPDVLANHADCHLVLVGDDWGAAQDLKDLANRLGVAEAVTLTGPLFDHMFTGAYQAADVFVHPSASSEAYGITVVEAMAAGKPAVVTQVGGRSSFFENERNGFLVPPGDSKALSKGIVTLLDNPELMRKIGQNNIADASQFSWQKVVSDMVDCYQRILSSRQN